MRWLPRSLHARMLALSAAATLLALGLAGWFIAGVLERFVTQGLDRRLDSEVALLATTVADDGRIDRARLGRRVGALEDGRGWRWQIAAPGGTIGSADFPTLGAPPPPASPGPPGPPGPLPPAQDALHGVEGAAEDGTAVHARRVFLHTSGGVVTITTAAPRDVVRGPIRAALVPLLLILATLGVLLGAATLVQLQLGLRPLRRLRDQVAAIRAGRRAALDEDQPTELLPLAIELNALASENAAALATARLSAANLAHALKTPVAALAIDVRGEPARAAQVARINGIVRHHLARARSSLAAHRARAPLDPAIGDLIHTMERIYCDRALTFSYASAPTGREVAIDPADLAELLGNILDNAAKNATSKVDVRLEDDSDARFLRVRVSDDGPGIPAVERLRVAQPGVRLDEQAEGHGFGLAIASDLAALYGGQLMLSERDGGGLVVDLRLPRDTAR